METGPIIEIKGVGKRYNINHRRGGYIALRDVIMDTLRSPLKYLKAKVRKTIGKEIKEEFWALKDVNASINKGEVIGIIGPNGSGKSTLLKILTGITPPTEGEIIMHGKVASLLEVGTGFHPELTGRENIFLNGAIIGMTQKEIAEKFDAIVEFAGIEKFLDTPVKYYSSGMYVRLAFSVAAHMEPDILLVDEVLAVGDAEFQKKCLGKMEEVTKTEGRTILFVSHNMSAIKQLCTKTILLEKGEVKMFGETNKVIDTYSKLWTKKETAKDLTDSKNHSGESIYSFIIDLKVFNPKNNREQKTFLMGEDILLLLKIKIKKKMTNAEIGIKLSNINGVPLSYFVSTWEGLSCTLDEGIHEFSILIPKIAFLPGKYFFSPWISSKGHVSDDNIQGAIPIEIFLDEINGKITNFPNQSFGGNEVYLSSFWTEMREN